MIVTAQTVGYVAGATLVAAELSMAAVVFFCHERMSQKFPRLTAHMSIGVKTTSYRFFAGLDTFLITLLVTGNPWAGAGVVGFEVMTKFFLFYTHEWVWNRPFLARLMIERKQEVGHESHAVAS